MKIVAVIPARYQASRFPGKLLQKLGDKTVITSTYLSVVKTNLFDEVIVAADDQRIIQEIEKNNGKTILTSSNHESGSDRIAEVVQNMDVDIVVNVQGDEPFTQKKPLQDLIEIFKKDEKKEISVATLIETLTKKEEIKNPNNVKVVLDKEHNALYFSRSVVPFPREQNSDVTYYKHIGIYAYRKNALMDFTQLPQGNLEKIEKLEQLRYLENGYKIRVAETPYTTIGIDTPQDLEKARAYLKQLEQ